MSNTDAKGLTREAVVDAAIALVEEGGPAALSMRKLGAALGVEAMSLYTYFPTKHALEIAMSDRVLNGLEGYETRDAVADAIALTNAIRSRLVDHPYTMRLFTVRMSLFESEAIQRLIIEGLKIVSRIEQDADVVLHRFRAVLAFVLGHTLIEIAIREAGVPEDELAKAQAAFEAGVRSLLLSA